MIRLFVFPVALATLPMGARGDETAVRLQVWPMPAPKPALKYLLLPEVHELKPGNPAQWYLRCFQEQRYFFFSKEANAERARYRSMPLAELPAAKLRGYGGSALTQADWAARLDAVDWQVLDRVQTEGVDLMLPELGPLRILGTALQVRFRAEVAGRRFDDGVRTAKTMFALARHLGDYPAEAANLLGLSVADLALETLEEMVQQPGCPNLYWALTDLPCPVVELRKGLQGNRTLVAGELRPLRGDAPMTESQMEAFVGRLSGVLGFAREQAGQAPRNLRAELRARANDKEKIGAAGRRLIEAGFGWVLVLRLPPMQIVLLDEKRDYEERRDEAMKILALPCWQVDAVVGGKDPERGAEGLFANLLPHVITARLQQGRLEQRVALLRHVEALRLYTAAHNGKLPKALTDIAVPLPADPFTDKPFVYKVAGETAQLHGTPPRGEEKNPAYNVRYEVSVRK